MLVRTIFGSLATSALIAGGLAAPASAHGDHHHHHHHADEVKVLVCAKFDDHHHGDDHGDQRSADPGDDHHSDNQQVGVWVRTDEDRSSTTLSDGQCARFELDFHRSLLSVYAATQDHGDEIRFKVFGDVVGSWSRDNQLKVRFDDSTRDPFVGVGVGVDSGEHHHHHHDDH